MYIINTSTNPPAYLSVCEYWQNFKNFLKYSVNDPNDSATINNLITNQDNIIFIIGEHFLMENFFSANKQIFELIKIRIENNLPCKLIYDYSGEPWFESEKIDILINFFIQELKLSFKDFLILCHANQHDSFSNYWLNDSTFLINWPEIDAYHWAQKGPEKFTSSPLYSRPNLLGVTASKLTQKNWRAYFIKELYEKNLLDKALISVAGHAKEFENISSDKNFINLMEQRISYFGDKEPKFINSELGYTVEDELNYGALTSSKSLYANCRLNCVLETSGVDIFNNQNNFHNRITEKTYKAILNKTVFTVLGHPAVYKLLSLSGYNVFQDFINCDQFESMMDGKKIVESYVNISMTLLEQIPSNLNQMQEIVDFNYHFLMARGQKHYSEYQDVLNNFITG